MKFHYGMQDMSDLQRAQESSFLLTNGLGGYSSMTVAFSAPRCDQGILVAAVKAPNERISLVHRLREKLYIGDEVFFLSTQEFADDTPAEDGYRYLSCCSVDGIPVWEYEIRGVRVVRKLAMAYGENSAAVHYTIENHSGLDCTLEAEPVLKLEPKEQVIEKKKPVIYDNRSVKSGKHTVYLRSDGIIEKCPVRWEMLSYPEDAKDGRPEKGMAFSCHRISKAVKSGERETMGLVFETTSGDMTPESIIGAEKARLTALENSCGYEDELARQLAVAADAYIAHRDSTNGKTILAGYPLFSDWGRDTMIALQGCCLSTGRFEDAKSILRTFFAYEKDGLVPNLFPEGQSQPMYNTVDAALLLFECVWQYVQRTGDREFAAEAFPVMERIIAAYRKGTHHAIFMDTDGLIHAGDGLDQVTWMDVCVQGILPTPRHGKPVEINAYWYNALKIMEEVSSMLKKDGADYGKLAEQVKESFTQKFYMADKGYLKDVLSGTKADEQLRCNQIWAISLSFTMLSPEQEKRVVDTVARELHTPCGLRTLDRKDPEYHGFYGGDQVKRDMAYHQGTVWVFPMGAYYLAYLKTRGNTGEAASEVRQQLNALHSMLREGCAGQLPEIYDGDFPREGKGCFAQAWSVGEMLRVFEAIEMIEKK